MTMPHGGLAVLFALEYATVVDDAIQQAVSAVISHFPGGGETGCGGADVFQERCCSRPLEDNNNGSACVVSDPSLSLMVR